MSIAMERLLRLSELLRDAAERKVQRRLAALRQANAAVNAAQEEAARIREEVAKRRDQTREVFLGAIHARRAVELLLSDLTGLDQAEEQAEAAIKAAIEHLTAAQTALGEARKALQAVEVKVIRRDRIVAEHRQTSERRREAAAETEALDQWTALQSRRTAS